MTGRTHDLAAFSAINIIVATQFIPNISLSTTITAVGFCFIGGLTPDIDKSTSEFWHKIPAGSYFGKLVEPFLGAHRHFSHSILGLILFGWGVNYLLNLMSKTLLVNMDIVWIAFMIGFISHLIMDSFTVEGVPWLFPIPIHLGFPPFRALRIKTGGLIEKAIVFPGLLILNGYLFFHFYEIYLSFFRNFAK